MKNLFNDLHLYEWKYHIKDYLVKIFETMYYFLFRLVFSKDTKPLNCFYISIEQHFEICCHLFKKYIILFFIGLLTQCSKHILFSVWNIRLSFECFLFVDPGDRAIQCNVQDRECKTRVYVHQTDQSASVYYETMEGCKEVPDWWERSMGREVGAIYFCLYLGI